MTFSCAGSKGLFFFFPPSLVWSAAHRVGRRRSPTLHHLRLRHPTLACRHAFITSAPALNLREQTAVYCSGGDGVKISNRLIARRDNSAGITVIHQKGRREKKKKSALTCKSLRPTFYFSSGASARKKGAAPALPPSLPGLPVRSEVPQVSA